MEIEQQLQKMKTRMRGVRFGTRPPQPSGSDGRDPRETKPKGDNGPRSVRLTV